MSERRVLTGPIRAINILLDLLSPRTLVLFLAAFGIWISVPAMPAAADYIQAAQAFENSPVCSSSDLGSDVDEARANPEWKPVNGLTIDPNNPVLNDKPTILEGFVALPAIDENSDSQATSEVSEEDIVWNHYTHDFTFKVEPDLRYQSLLSSWNRYPGTSFFVGFTTADELFCDSLGGSLQTNGTCVVPAETCPDGTTAATCHHTDMEIEWDNASLMDEGHFQRIWGALPEFVWPAVGDRVWAEGRWIFDCGHPNVPAAAQDEYYVKYSTEIHPPRALATFRLNHPALDSFPTARTSAPNFPFPQSYLPVTGVPTTLPPDAANSGPTNVPVTEADLFVSGNGGGANDLCMIMALNGSDCVFGHTTPVIAVNNYNYVFDIYPPGTSYLLHPQAGNATFKVIPPVADASLQWRTVDHFSELPAHACGSSPCQTSDTVAPIFCPIDATTPPVDLDPENADTSCPAVPAHPTRLRVILPFKGTSAKVFAQSVLLGWDDVPVPTVPKQSVRTFKVTLHKFTVNQNGESFLHDGDWRVFVNVGGQYRYISQLFDAKGDGTSVCNGANSLTENGDDDCYLFDKTPWTVSVQDGTSIHVAVGGFESDAVDAAFCDQFPPGGDQCEPFRFGSLVDLATGDDDRIGTYEFDLTWPNYQWTMPDGSPRTSFQTQATSKEGTQYTVEFHVEEIPSATAPASAALIIGSPQYGQFVSSATPLTLGSMAPDVEGFQYRFYPQGGPLPTYASSLPFPLHWNHIDLPTGAQSIPVFLTGGDGPTLLQYSAETFGQLLEPRHTATVTVDNTPPIITVTQPQPIPYAHSAVLTLNYSVIDAGSGVQSVTATMDGAATVAGHGLLSGQPINLLTELALGAHTFSVTATDNVKNTGAASATFTIIVTPESIKGDVNYFLSHGGITSTNEGNSLLQKLKAAAAYRTAGDCKDASATYQAFINELNAQTGKTITAAAATIMIADARYLIGHCP